MVAWDDLFDRPDQAGLGDEYTAISGSWSIVGGAAETTGSGTSLVIATAPARTMGSDDHRCSSVITAFNTSVGHTLRGNAEGNTFYHVRHNGSAVQIYRFRSGQSAVLLRQVADTAQLGVEFTSEVEGRFLRGYVNGVLVNEVEDTSVDAILTGRHVGMRATAANNAFDHLAAEDLGAPTQPGSATGTGAGTVTAAGRHAGPYSSLTGLAYRAVGDSSGAVGSYTSTFFWEHVAEDGQTQVPVVAHIGSDTWQDIASRAMGTGAGSRTHPDGLTGLISAVGGGNDVGQFNGSTAGHRGFRHAIGAYLARVRAAVLEEDGHATTGSWTVVNASGFASAGRYSTCTAPGTSVTVNFTGTDFTFLLLGPVDGTSGSTFRVEVDGQAHGTGATIDQGRPSINNPWPWVHVPYHVRDLTPGTHTAKLIHTGTSGQALAVDCGMTWGDTPPLAVLLEIPEFGPTGYDSWGPAPYPTTADTALFNQAMREVVAEFPDDGTVLIATLPDWDPVTMTGADDIHPNDAGHRYIATRILDTAAGLTTEPTAVTGEGTGTVVVSASAGGTAVPATVTLSGVVTAGGQPLAGAEVWTHSPTTGVWTAAPLTGADGAYSLTVAPGEHLIYIYPNETGYPNQWIGGGDDQSAAMVFDLTADTTYDINLSVVVSGTVTIGDSPLEGAIVWTHNPVTGVWTEAAPTDADGFYSLTVAPDEHIVYVYPNEPGYPDRWIGGPDQASATVFDLTADTTIDIRIPEIVTGTGSGGVGTTGSGQGHAVALGGGAGGVAVASDGNGGRVATGTSQASVAVSALGNGGAVGVATGTGSGTVRAAATGAGRAVATGAGVGALAVTAEAEGRAILAGLGTGALTVAGMGNGLAATPALQGSGTGGTQLTAEGAGHPVHIGSGVGNYAVAVTGSGHIVLAGRGTGTAILTAAGAGDTSRRNITVIAILGSRRWGSGIGTRRWGSGIGHPPLGGTTRGAETMSTLWQLPRETVEWVGPVVVTANGAPAAFELAFLPDRTRPTEADWQGPVPLDGGYGLMVGPVEEQGIWKIWARTVDNPETVVLDNVGTVLFT